MATLKDYRNERLRKLEKLKQLGINPYPAKAERTHVLASIVERFSELESQDVTVAGRITSIRKFGKIAFIVLKDASGSLQVFLAEDRLAGLDADAGQLGIEQLHLLDTGDFLQVSGSVIKTKTDEISVEAHRLRLLAKSLRPMPNPQEGFTNKEERLRRRYIDMNVNEDVRQRFIRRSRFWQATRDFLNARDFLEVNIPVLEHTTGGADANPFVTHMDALGQDFYLRISHELPLKRLIGGGYEKVYDIGPRFRNENYSDEHLPEHVAMEWYWAYADWQDGMEMMEQMLREVLASTFGTVTFTLNGKDIDMSRPWERWDYATVIREHYGLEVFDCTIEQVKEQLAKHSLEVEKTENIARGIDKLWKKVRAGVAGPVWLINTPTFISPLSKTDDKDPRFVQRFQAVIGGSELCNGWSELNDPVDQLNRFLEQQNMRDAGDNEAQMLDIDYIEMLEYGMPPSCGLGYSERLFWIFEGVTAREGVPFPQLRREVDEVTKGIYPEVAFEKPKITSKPTQKAVSAIDQGTKKQYLIDFNKSETEASVVNAAPQDDNRLVLVLDQTIFYPGGGGQPFDLGTISWQGGTLSLDKVSKDQDGIVYHAGTFDGGIPETGQEVKCLLDTDRRKRNSRCHSAGHLIDYAVQLQGLDWQPGRGAHHPDMSFVEYTGTFDANDAEILRTDIEKRLSDVIDKGGRVTTELVDGETARARSKYIPEAVLQAYENVQLAHYGDDFAICCGGTHVDDIAAIGRVLITKVKKKDGNIRVSYQMAE